MPDHLDLVDAKGTLVHLHLSWPWVSNLDE